MYINASKIKGQLQGQFACKCVSTVIIQFIWHLSDVIVTFMLQTSFFYRKILKFFQGYIDKFQNSYLNQNIFYLIFLSSNEDTIKVRNKR